MCLESQPTYYGIVDVLKTTYLLWNSECAKDNLTQASYLFDVGPSGGGTLYFPGSHAAVGRYFEAHPGRFVATGARGRAGPDCMGLAQSGPSDRHSLCFPLYSVLLLSATSGLDCLGRALSRPGRPAGSSPGTSRGAGATATTSGSTSGR